MGYKFAEIAFTDSVKALQEAMGSRKAYARREGGEADFNDRLGPNEAAFIGTRDSFYMATVGETGWPYIQHRGGPKGFVRVVDEKTLGFADLTGNRQYVSVVNLAKDSRVSLFFMDYPNRARLKLFGRARVVGLDDKDLMAALAHGDYRARIERGIVIAVEGFDWNCPQHITPRFTAEDAVSLTRPLEERIATLEAELARVRPDAAKR
jgi:hypothetical protein